MCTAASIPLVRNSKRKSGILSYRSIDQAITMEPVEEPSLAQCCKGLRETKQSWALQDHGYMIWAPEETKLPRSRVEPAASSRTLVWWDMESSPPPLTTECNVPWDDIALCLVRMLALPNSGSMVTCIAYGAGEVPEPLLTALHNHGIVVHRRNLPTSTLPGEGTTLGMKSMIVDILFWALKNAPPAEVRIITATNEANFRKLVRGLVRREYKVHLAGDCFAGESSSSSFTSVWNSFWKQQAPENSLPEEQALSLANLHLLQACFTVPRPTYRDVASGPELSHDGSRIMPQASMADVRGWLESFVELEESLLGMNISLVAKSFEKQGMKLDVKQLGCLTLSRLLLDKCSDLVRLKYPSKDCTVMLPANLGAQAMHKLMVDFESLLTELLPQRDSESPMSLVKTAFKARFGYDLEHEAAGYPKLNQFLSSIPRLVRVRQCSTQGKELVICRPSGFFAKRRT